MAELSKCVSEAAVCPRLFLHMRICLGLGRPPVSTCVCASREYTGGTVFAKQRGHCAWQHLLRRMRSSGDQEGARSGSWSRISDDKPRPKTCTAKINNIRQYAKGS
ncbi:hypothetical protein NDU88_001158 [Pleurodeles waltl]|uniref:Secreted protein n=1 Tax=Pleurodeles waltl TaxID=8319 RepID=A0AAV7NCL7_PLEWA|nr:hypothetical protein NDU88_001158 [Pleurodeles waltl]